jgi:HSP20 family protein
MYYDPFEEIARMHEEMDRLFRRSFNGFEKPLLEDKSNKSLTPWQSFGMRTPVCHLHETESKVMATIEIPGVNKSDIELNVDDTGLEIKVDAKQEKKHGDKDNKVYGYSMQQQSFYRKLPFPKEVDSSKATAEYKDGVLRVEAPKKHQIEASGKRLQIR